MKMPSLATLEQQVLMGTRLSMIYDTETVNEDESTPGQNENVEVSDDEYKKPVGLDKFRENDDLMDQISRRSSMLKAEEEFIKSIID